MLSEIQYGKTIPGEIIDFTMMECGGCGIPFFVPTRWYKNKVNNHDSFWCPNGCNRVFTGKSETEKLKQQIEELKQQKEKEREALENKWLDALGEKQKLERQLKRVHKGVCPCCNRSFINLEKHMKTKHPEAVVAAKR